MSIESQQRVRKDGFSVQLLLVSTVLCVIGFTLLAMAPRLSLFNLIGFSLIWATAGVVIGYLRDGWRGSIYWGMCFGIGSIVVLYLVMSAGVLPEKDLYELPGPQARTAR